MIKRIRDKSIDSLEKLAIKTTRWIGSTSSILVHTAIFIIFFALYYWGVDIDKILLVLTTLVSLEAIYLSIFIQMSVNRQTRKLHAVALDVEDIQEDVEDIQKDVEDIQEDVEDIQEDVEDIQEDEEEEKLEKEEDQRIDRIENMLGKLIEEIIDLKKQQKQIKEVKKLKNEKMTIN